MSELKRIFEGEEYSLYAKTMESKKKNPMAKQIEEYIKRINPKAKVRLVGGRVYLRL